MPLCPMATPWEMAEKYWDSMVWFRPISTLQKACLNVRGDVITNVGLAEGPRGGNRCRDCDAYRLDALEAKMGFIERSCPAGLGSTPHIPAHRLLG